jgi:glucokinase
MIIDNIKTRVVAVDINVDKTICAIVDVRGNLIDTCNFATSDYPDIGNFIAVLCDHVMELTERNGGYESIRSVGIASPSGNVRTGCLENAPNMPWKGVVPLAAMLRDRLGLAVALGNNAHVMALAENTFGAAHGMRDFVVVSLGSGMGSCFFSNGTAHLGNNGFAGEIGHTCVEYKGRPCGCGNLGCLEAYTATKGILRTASEVMAESDKPSKMRQVEKLTPHMIAEFCELGDELSIEVYRRTGYWLGVGLANYCSVLNPEAVIFTGIISRAGKWILEPANAAFEEHVFHNIQGKVKFILSTLDDYERNLLGARVLAWEVKEYSLFK